MGVKSKSSGLAPPKDCLFLYASWTYYCNLKRESENRNHKTFWSHAATVSPHDYRTELAQQAERTTFPPQRQRDLLSRGKALPAFYKRGLLSMALTVAPINSTTIRTFKEAKYMCMWQKKVKHKLTYLPQKSILKR